MKTLNINEFTPKQSIELAQRLILNVDRKLSADATTQAEYDVVDLLKNTNDSILRVKSKYDQLELF